VLAVAAFTLLALLGGAAWALFKAIQWVTGLTG
jgi:hypothetical protein